MFDAERVYEGQTKTSGVGSLATLGSAKAEAFNESVEAIKPTSKAKVTTKFGIDLETKVETTLVDLEGHPCKYPAFYRVPAMDGNEKFPHLIMVIHLMVQRSLGDGFSAGSGKRSLAGMTSHSVLTSGKSLAFWTR